MIFFLFPNFWINSHLIFCRQSVHLEACDKTKQILQAVRRRVERGNSMRLKGRGCSTGSCWDAFAYKEGGIKIIPVSAGD